MKCSGCGEKMLTSPDCGQCDTCRHRAGVMSAGYNKQYVRKAVRGSSVVHTDVGFNSDAGAYVRVIN